MTHKKPQIITGTYLVKQFEPILQIECETLQVKFNNVSEVGM